MKTKVYCALAFLLVSGISAYVGALAKQHEVVATASVVLLADAQQEFEILSLLESQQKLDERLRQKFDYIFATRLVLVSAYRPEVHSLDAIGAEGLCNLILYYEDNDLATKESPEMADLASSYIKEIREPLMEKVKRGQDLTGRTGCDMIGDKNGAT